MQTMYPQRVAQSPEWEKVSEHGEVTIAGAVTTPAPVWGQLGLGESSGCRKELLPEAVARGRRHSPAHCHCGWAGRELKSTSPILT